MRVDIKVQTNASDEKDATYHLKRKLHNYDDRLPMPVTGDTIYIDGVFIDVTGRCITPIERQSGGDAQIEIFGTVPMEQFKELEHEGWQRD